MHDIVDVGVTKETFMEMTVKGILEEEYSAKLFVTEHGNQLVSPPNGLSK